MRSADQLVSFMEVVNEEIAIGTTAAETLLAAPAPQWPNLLAQNPAWLRTGTFDVLLANARDEMNRSLIRAQDITSFVLTYVLLARTQPGAEILLDLVLGTAHKDHASVLYRRGREFLAEALRHVQEALRVFGRRPAMFLERANARFVQAQVYQALEQFNAAFALLDECEQVFAEQGDAYRYVQVLAQRGYCHFDLGAQAYGGAASASFRQAFTAFRDALAEAERIGERIECARLLNNLGHCANELGEHQAAREYLELAVHEFTALAMTADVQRALWGVAQLELAAGQHHLALRLLHEIYNQFVERGMLGDAALVRLDITVKLAVELNDARLAQEECEQLVRIDAWRHLPPNVRAAAQVLRGRTVTTTNVVVVRDFLERYQANATSAFSS